MEVDRPLNQLIALSPAPIRNILLSGGSAVGIFFLLSGFVLAYNYDLGTAWTDARRRAFWTARIARIYPVYLFALAFGLPSLFAGLLKLGPLHIPSMLLSASLVLTLLQAWSPAVALFWGGPAWSLSVEAFFYLTFPYLGFRLWKTTRVRNQIAAIAALWITICAATLLLAVFFSSSQPRLDAWRELIKFNPLLRLPEFLAGILLCKLYVTLSAQPFSRSLGPRLYFTGFMLVLFTCAFEDRLSYLLLFNGLLLPASAAVLLGLSFGGGVLHRWLSSRQMVSLGQASYSMYLVHMGLLSFFAAGAKRFHQTEAQHWLFDLVFFVTLFSLSAAVFSLIEEPARRAILKRLRHCRGLAAPNPEAQTASADPF